MNCTESDEVKAACISHLEYLLAQLKGGKLELLAFEPHGHVYLREPEIAEDGTPWKRWLNAYQSYQISVRQVITE